MKIVISFLLKRLIKNNLVVNKNINGNISKINEGEFNKAKEIIKFVFTKRFLKKSSSLKIFKIITKPKVIKKTKKNDFKNNNVINLI